MIIGEKIESPSELAAWDDAFRRVESYLRAHRIESRVRLNELTSRIIAEAREIVAAHPGSEPVTVALQVTDRHLGEWFVRVWGQGDQEDERFRARGRLALVMTDSLRKWPEALLSDGAVPQELVSALDRCAPRAGPEICFTNMAPRSVEFSITDTTGKVGRSLSRSLLFGAGAIWLAFVGALGIAWAASH